MSETRFKPYPETKDSGIEWLGRIPKQWNVVRLKHHANFDNSGIWGDEPEECAHPIPVARTADISMTGQLDFEGMPLRCIRDSEKKSYVCKPGHIVVVKSSGSVSSVITGKAALVTNEMPEFSFSNFLMRVLPSNATWDERFLYAFLTSYIVRRRIDLMVSGTTYPNLKVGEYKSFEIPRPEKPEQQAIADFLDRETARIDALVEKKERLIELLQEKRTALITHAVTKGLDPDIPMKDSGIEWLGQIPARWQAKRLKHLIAEPLKYGANEAATLDDPELPRYVRITDIDDSDALRDETFRSLPSNVAEPYLLEQGDVLFARSGATAGKTFLYQESWGRCAYAGYLIRARLDREQVRPRFARFFTASTAYWQWLSSVFIQATIQNVSAEKYADLRIPIPPTIEQDKVLEFLDRETAKIDALIAKVGEAIERLKEYRTALISAAVTGKIDVREETRATTSG